jgi:hypothetical protein
MSTTNFLAFQVLLAFDITNFFNSIDPCQVRWLASVTQLLGGGDEGES